MWNDLRVPGTRARPKPGTVDVSPNCPLRRWSITWESLRVTFTWQYFVLFIFFGRYLFSKKWECLLPGYEVAGVCLYLAPVGRNWELGHLEALWWELEEGGWSLGAFARTLLTNWPQTLCFMSQLTHICHRLYICVSDPSLFYPSWMLKCSGLGKEKSKQIDCWILRWQKWREGLAVPCDGKCCEHREGLARPLKAVCIFRETKTRYQKKVFQNQA